MINKLVFRLFENDHGFDHGQAQVGYSVHTQNVNTPIIRKSNPKQLNKFIQNLRRKTNQGSVKIDSQRSDGRPTSPI